MAVKTYIIDPRSGRKATVVDGDEVNALAVATRPLKTYDPDLFPFLNPIEGAALNVDASSSGIPKNIHDGTDNIYWTASIISGIWDFASVTQQHTGAKSIDATLTVNDSTSQYVAAAPFDAGGYTQYTGWIYLDSWDDRGTKDIEILGWNTGTGLSVGLSASLRIYIDITNIGSWQRFAIPLADMGLGTGSTIDAFRIKTVSTPPGLAPAYFLDDMKLQQAGAVIYEIIPTTDTWAHIIEFSVVIVAPYVGTLADGTMPKIPYDGLLGVPLATGLVYQVIFNEDTTQIHLIKNIVDFMSIPGAYISGQGCDGVNTWISLDLKFDPIVLKPEDDAKLRLIVSDDLSSLLIFRIIAAARVETRFSGIIT